MAKRKNTEGEAPKPPAQKPIQIVSVKRGRRNVVIHYTKGDASFELDERDNPLPAFYAAFDALPPVVGTICHLSVKYTGSGLRVIKLDVGEKGGVATVALHCRKDIDDAAKEFAFKTPERLLAHPTQEGKYTPPLPQSDVALVEEMIEQAKQYVMGNRAQGEIQFEADEEDDDGDDDGKTEEFPGLTEPAKKAD
jgi:hypothetical protein